MKDSVSSSSFSFGPAWHDSGKTLTHYFSTKKRIQKSRFNEFVLLSAIPQFITKKDKTTLNYDSDELIASSKVTINSLQNEGKKVYPLPFAPIKKEIDNTSPESLQLKPLSLAKSHPFIQMEKQLTPVFHIVGHGTPNGVGFLDPALQISPLDFADKLDELFKDYELNLEKKDFSIIFHTCNSAYAKLSPHLSKQEILDRVQEKSFIGLFYTKMKELGYQKISVSGFRGYYCNLATHNATGSLVQDSFTYPNFVTNAINGSYTIHKDRCTTMASNEQLLSFPIPLLDDINKMEGVDELESEIPFTVKLKIAR